MASLQELLAQKAALDKQIAETQRQERAEAVNKVRALMAEYGLTATDVMSRAAGSAQSRISGAAGKKVAVKYRHPETGETWTGRGLQPKWLKNAVAEGKQPSDFAV